jgi:hypothetical protein
MTTSSKAAIDHAPTKISQINYRRSREPECDFKPDSHVISQNFGFTLHAENHFKLLALITTVRAFNDALAANLN